MTRFIRFILRHRSLVAAVLLLSIALAAYSSRTIRLRFQFRDFYDYPGNPQLALFKEDTRDFGDPAGYVVAMIESGDVFAPEVLRYVRTLTASLEPEKVFVRIRSLTTAQVIRGEGDDVVSGPLSSAIPETEAARLELKRFALESPLLRRRLVSVDGKVTAVAAEMRSPVAFATIDEQRQALQVVKNAVHNNPTPPGVRVRVTGSPAVEVGVTDSLIKDQMVLMPAVILVLTVMLFLTFRSFHGILLCLSAVTVATIWTAGLFAMLHRPVDIIGSLIPTSILVYGVVDPIFVLARVLNKLDAGRSKEDAIIEAFSELGLPCFLTSLTTAVGFGVFVTANALSIRYYGITVAAGVLLAWLTSITVLPLLLYIAPVPKRRFAGAWLTQKIDDALVASWEFVRVRSKQALVVVGIVLIGGGWLARRQHLDNTYVDSMPLGSARDDVKALERSLTGVMRVIVHLEGPPDAMKQPPVLNAIAAVDAAMAHESLVTHSSSLAALVSEANQAFQGGGAEGRHVPASAFLTAQYLALIDPGDRSDFVTDDYSKSHIDILLEDPGSEKTRAFVGRLRRTVEKAGFEALGVKARLTGNGVVAYDELDSVVVQVLNGFVLAFIAIVLLEWVALRSLRIALISVVPNLLPVLACFLALRVLDIHLKIDSSLVLCISIGGLFNTTIHYAARILQRTRETTESPDVVILHAIRAIGPAALFTAVTLSAGFAVLTLSHFPTLRALGLLSMVTLLTGFVSDMVVTSVLMRLGLDWGKYRPDVSLPLREAAYVAGAARAKFERRT